jgi:hypothetical protein
MNDATLVTETPVKRGRGRPRLHPINNLNFVRTVGFRAGVLAYAAMIPVEATDSKLNLLGRKFAAWHYTTFAGYAPASPQKGQWLRNYSAFMNVFPLAEKAGVFDMSDLHIAETEAEVAAEEVAETPAEVVAEVVPEPEVIDYTQLTPMVVHEVPMRGPGGRFLSKAERAELQFGACVA